MVSAGEANKEGRAQRGSCRKSASAGRERCAVREMPREAEDKGGRKIRMQRSDGKGKEGRGRKAEGGQAMKLLSRTGDVAVAH